MYGVPGSVVLSGGPSNVPNPPMVSPNNLFRYGEQALWSSNRWIGATPLANNNFRYFVTPLGQQGSGFGGALTIAETNVKVGGQLPQNQSYDVYGVSYQVGFGATGTSLVATPVDTQILIGALLNIQFNSVLVWNFTQTSIEIAPIYLIGAGGGAFGSVSSTQNAVDRGHMNNGAGNIWVYRQWPITLPALTVFSLIQFFGSMAVASPAASETVGKVALLGFYRNAIETA